MDIKHMCLGTAYNSWMQEDRDQHLVAPDGSLGQGRRWERVWDTRNGNVSTQKFIHRVS